MDKFIGNFKECLQLVYNMPKSGTNDAIIASVVEKFGQQLSEILKQAPEYLTGVVTYYQGTFGFVNSNGTYYFIHRSNIKANAKRPYLRSGEKVKFTVSPSVWPTDLCGREITQQATNLSVVDGGMLKCDKRQIKKQVMQQAIRNVPKFTEEELIRLHESENFGVSYWFYLTEKERKKFASRKNAEVVEEMKKLYLK